LEIKDSEGGKKCLSPSIFRKSKGPVVLAAPMAPGSEPLRLAGARRADNAPAGGTGAGNGGGGAIASFTLADYDINLCADITDLHRKMISLIFIVQSYKCFENYLGMVS
jgi:hypothetical protein